MSNGTALQERSKNKYWEVQSVQDVGGAEVLMGRMAIRTADGGPLPLQDSSVASVLLESVSKAPAAASRCLILFEEDGCIGGVGLELWGG